MTCGVCKFYLARNENAGACRRYPKQVSITFVPEVDLLTSQNKMKPVTCCDYPIMRVTDSCGEFKHMDDT